MRVCKFHEYGLESLNIEERKRKKLYDINNQFYRKVTELGVPAVRACMCFLSEKIEKI